MDRQVIEQKFESLRRRLARIRERAPATAAERERDPDAQDVLTLNLTRAVQLCVDIGTHLIATRHLEDFTAFAAAIMTFMGQRQDRPR